MTAILDTHFLIWLLLGAGELARFPWLERYRPWGVSPVSFLEIQCLSEVGKLTVNGPELMATALKDPRFVVDEVSLSALTRHALKLSWTRDPFDRLLCAHSRARRVALCSLDQTIQRNHPFLVAELG